MHVAGITVIGKTEVYLRPCLVEGVTVLVGADVRKSGYNITDQPFRSDQPSANIDITRMWPFTARRLTRTMTRVRVHIRGPDLEVNSMYPSGLVLLKELLEPFLIGFLLEDHFIMITNGR